MKHWSEEDFTHWLYGLKTDGIHLDECSECRDRAGQISRRREQSAQAPEVSRTFLDEQRRNIYRRLEDPIRNWMPVRWAASVAMLVMAVLLSFAYLHTDPANPPLANPGDDKLFSELVSIEQSNEPRAIKPIHSLFQQ